MGRDSHFSRKALHATEVSAPVRNPTHVRVSALLRFAASGLPVLISSLGCGNASESRDSGADGAGGGSSTALVSGGGEAGQSGEVDGGGAGQGGSTASVGGSTSDTGSCNDAVSPDEELVRSCVLSNACDPLVPAFSVSMCITYDTLDDCSENAENCATVVDCNKRTWEPSSECESGDTGWKCVGSRAIQCSDEYPWSVDCAGMGGICLLYSGSDTDAVWPCWVESPSSCTDPEGQFSCSGDTRYTCRDGLVFGVDCSAVGLSCIAPTTGQAYCGSPPATCDAPSTSSCSSNTVQLCSGSGYAFSYDCTRSGGNCETDGALDWYCPALGCTKEDELACTEECVDANVMKVCVGGAPYHIDCTDYGFSQCMLYHDPTDDSTYVGCH